MGFKILLDLGNGEPLVVAHEFTDTRVTRVGLTGRSGEAGAMGIAPDQTEAVLTFSYAPNTGVPTLQDLEAMQHPSRTGEEVEAAQAALSGLPTAVNTGSDVFLGEGDLDIDLTSEPDTEPAPQLEI